MTPVSIGNLLLEKSIKLSSKPCLGYIHYSNRRHLLVKK